MVVPDEFLRALVYAAGGSITIPDDLLLRDDYPPLVRERHETTLSTTYRLAYPTPTITIDVAPRHDEREAQPALPPTKGKPPLDP